MIRAAAGAHRVLLERAQRRRRLSRVEDRDAPPAAASTKRRVSVAMPDSRCRKLSAVRSAVSIAPPRRGLRRRRRPARTDRRRTATRRTHGGIELPERLGRHVKAGDHARRLREDDAARARSSTDRRFRRDVAPSEIFGQRPRTISRYSPDRAARTARSSCRRSLGPAMSARTSATSTAIVAGSYSNRPTPAALRTSTSTSSRPIATLALQRTSRAVDARLERPLLHPT